MDWGELTIALVRPQPWGLGDTELSSPTYGLDTMHPSRRSLPFPLNCQLVRVGTADYGGASEQVSRNSEARELPDSTHGVCFGNEDRHSMLAIYLRSLRCVVSLFPHSPAPPNLPGYLQSRPTISGGKRARELPYMVNEVL